MPQADCPVCGGTGTEPRGLFGENHGHSCRLCRGAKTLDYTEAQCHSCEAVRPLSKLDYCTRCNVWFCIVPPDHVPEDNMDWDPCMSIHLEMSTR